MKSVIDSSVWIEALVSGRLDGPVARVMEAQVVVPTVVLLEVTKWLRRHMPLDAVYEFAAMMSQHEVVPLGADIALRAAELAVEHKLSLGDSIIYATADVVNAQLWTMDKHFAGLPGVRMLEKATGGGRRGV